MKETLNPCPFCGGEAILNECPHCGELNIEVSHADDCWVLEYEGYCDIAASEREQYIAAWNRRAERTCKRLRPYYGDAPVIGAPCICSECRQELAADHRYCPNCGAKVVSE